jgi:minor extracellular serine protease Vpr
VRKPLFAGVLVIALLTSVASAVAAPGGSPSSDTTSALVELVGDPLSTSARTRPAQGKKVDFSSTTVKSERARLSAIRNDFKLWLRKNAPKAKVTAELDIALHAVGVTLNGTTLATLRSAPMVRAAEFQALYAPLAHEDPDLTLVRANEAWTRAGGAENAGEDVKVAIIDSGIDQTHPCFDDTGYPAQQQLGQPHLTNNKVIVAKSFTNKVNQNGYDASPVNSHGTHVAGTVACNAHTPAVVDGVTVPYDPSGVAPRALLGNYNVFPGDIADAKSEDILKALEAAYEDGFDVANMSLGDKRNFGGSVSLAHAVDNMDLANMVVAVAAGNEGPGYFTVGYPGAAARALTAGASTVGHAFVNQVTVGGVDYEAVVGDFGELDSDLTAPLAVVADPTSGFPHGLNIACDDSPALPDLTGSIAMLGRGTCDFTVKMRNAQNAGAVGVIMANREPGAPFTMSHNGLEPQPTIPGVMVSLEDTPAIAAHDGDPATIRALAAYVTMPEETNKMAGFSSQGPTQQDLLVKPDVVAPGNDVLSSFPATHCDTPPCWAIIGGTSMATPHLAGAAAVVRGIHPTWGSAAVRSAVVNTAQEGVLRDTDTGAVTDDVLVVGAGLLDVDAATAATTALDPVSTSFGGTSSGGGRTLTKSVSVTNLSGTAATLAASVADDGADGVTFSTSGSSLTLAPGATGQITVSVSTAKGAADGPRQATLRVTSGGTEVAHSVLFVFVGEGDRAPGPHLGNRNTD